MCDGSTQAPMNELILSWLNSFNYRHKRARSMTMYTRTRQEMR